MTSGGEAAGFPQASAPGTDLARVFGPLDQRDAEQIREALLNIDSELAAFADELRQRVGRAYRAPRLAVYPGLASPIQGEVYGGDRHDVLVFIAGLAPVAPSSDRWRVYGTIDVDPPPDDTYPGEAMWEAFSLPEQSFAVPLDAVVELLDVVRQLRVGALATADRPGVAGRNRPAAVTTPSAAGVLIVATSVRTSWG